jgi:hypothetical protein
MCWISQLFALACMARGSGGALGVGLGQLAWSMGRDGLCSLITIKGPIKRVWDL